MLKRYQYLGSDGKGNPSIKWTDWFNWKGKEKVPYQYKGKGITLLNEYKEE